MGKNNAHEGESREKRLKRFQDGPPEEIIATVINSIANYFNNEIRATLKDPANPQTSLMFLGTHAVALTIGWGLLGKKDQQGYKAFLKKYVDGDTPDTKFSDIAEPIHQWRNTLAHAWLNIRGHSIGYDYTSTKGYELDGDLIIINPQIYLDHYMKAFGLGGKIYKYGEDFSADQLEQAKMRFLEKYKRER